MRKKGLLWIAGAVMTLILGRLLIFTPVTVHGISMAPTLRDREKLMGLKTGNVGRFDIITFLVQEDEEESYIKRVIGLPGEQIEYADDQLWVDGEAVSEPFLDELKENLEEGEQLVEDFFAEVPQDEYFVMGDNRQDSIDSRQIGSIPKEKIETNIKFSFWPIEDFGPIR